MQLAVEDLLCPSCRGYVHPFLACCPACGSARQGRLGDAIAGGDLGVHAIVEDGATHRVVHEVSLRYSHKPHSGQQPTDILSDGFKNVAGAMSYRAAATADGPTSVLPGGAATADTAAVTLANGVLAVMARPAGRALAQLPLESIVAATPIRKGQPAASAWAGLQQGERHVLPRRLLDEGDLLVTFAGRDAAGLVALSNRRGLLVERARPDHYELVARWLGILAAAAAEARWVAIGAEAYAAELGLRVADLAAAPGLGPTPAVLPGPDTALAEGPTSAIRPALEQLEELRGAGLVSETEYEAKRREILARL